MSDVVLNVATPAVRIADFARLVIGVLWFAYILIAPTVGFDWLPSWHDEQRAVQIVLLGLTAIIAALCTSQISQLWSKVRARWACVIFLGLASLSALFASFPAHAFADIALLIALCGLVVLTWSAVSQYPSTAARIVRWAATLIAGAHVIGILTRYGAAISLSQPLGMDVLLLGYANPRFPSALYALLIPFLASASIDATERRVIRAVVFALLCALWAINLALATRAIFFAYAIAALMFIASVGLRRARPTLGILGVSFACGVLLYWLMFVLMPAWLAVSAEGLWRSQADITGTNTRMSLWNAAIDVIIANPVLGIGPMHFAAIPHAFGAHPHNWVLQVAAEFGVPATLVLGYIVWSAFRHGALAARRGDEQVHRLVIPSYFAILVAAIYGLVDGNYLMPVSQSAIVVCLGVLLAGMLPNEGAARQPRKRLQFPWIFVAVLVGSSAYLLKYSASTLPSSVSAGDGWDLPRFWQQGLIIRLEPLPNE